MVGRTLPSGVVVKFQLDSQRATSIKTMSFFRLATHNLARSRLVSAISRTHNPIPWRASFSAPAGLTKETIETRVLDVLKGFEKVNPSKVLIEPFFVLCILVTYSFAQKLTTSSSFTNDLGLDSLDAVEVVMAVEEVRAISKCQYPPH